MSDQLEPLDFATCDKCGGTLQHNERWGKEVREGRRSESYQKYPLEAIRVENLASSKGWTHHDRDGSDFDHPAAPEDGRSAEMEKDRQERAMTATNDVLNNLQAKWDEEDKFHDIMRENGLTEPEPPAPELPEDFKP